jgi:ketosteroid isomerase-like protein
VAAIRSYDYCDGDAMRKPFPFSAFLLLTSFLCSSCGPTQKGGDVMSGVSEELIALERSALDRWITFDPQGYLDLYAPDVLYFDPNQERRVDGLEALKKVVEPIKKFKGAIKEPRYEMIAPRAQQYGDIALLTFNLINYGRVSEEPETVLARWNSTEVYRRIDGKWKIIHSHWSYIKPELKTRP